MTRVQNLMASQTVHRPADAADVADVAEAVLRQALQAFTAGILLFLLTRTCGCSDPAPNSADVFVCGRTTF